eukprot:10693711-Heterocapsa_arctica.AAC.1
MAPGVSLGVDRRLPRTPAIFERKTDWALSCAGDEQSKNVWASNYASARLRPDVLLAQFLEDEEEGLMCRNSMKEAKARW